VKGKAKKFVFVLLFWKRAPEFVHKVDEMKDVIWLGNNLNNLNNLNTSFTLWQILIPLQAQIRVLSRDLSVAFKWLHAYITYSP
jgi:hypothetical protein